MSAVAGILSLSGESIDRQELENIARTAAGNRVDALAFWQGESIGLAHALASVTPESVFEHQPLVDSTSGCVITFDGRLDNRAELQSTLIDHRELSDQTSDPAYILAAYLYWGNDFLNHLLGDFVFAIWNPRARQLLLARDPLGQRPLFYSLSSDRLIFASTIEQLLQDPDLPHDLDEDALPLYLYRYGILDEQTPYRAIKSLPGGTSLLAERDRVRVSRYWRLPDEPPEPRAFTEDDVAEFRSLFADAVRCRLRSHEPVGLLLSGGLDSSSIACMSGYLREQNDLPQVHAYTFAFDKFDSCDERRYIDATVTRYGLDYTPIVVDDCWTFSHFEQWLPVFSEPYFSPYEAMSYKVLDRARTDGVRTMLMGHGGDVLLDGSPRYFADLLLDGRWHDLHRQVRAYSAATKRPYPIGFVGNAINPLLPIWVRNFIEYRHWPHLKSLIPARLRAHRFDAPPKLYRGKNAWWYSLRNQLAFGASPHEAHIDRLMRLYGIEIRQPFLDVRLIHFILRLPPDAAYSFGKRRNILRTSLRDILPPSIRDRDDKATFAPMMDYGLRERHRAFIQALLEDSELARRGYVVPGPWSRAIQEYLHGKRMLYWVYWHSLVLETWLRIRSGRLPPLEP